MQFSRNVPYVGTHDLPNCMAQARISMSRGGVQPSYCLSFYDLHFWPHRSEKLDLAHTPDIQIWLSPPEQLGWQSQQGVPVALQWQQLLLDQLPVGPAVL
jgi:hypothetical protein